MSKFPKRLQCALFGVAGSAIVLGGTVQAVACQYAARTSDSALIGTFPTPVSSSAKNFVVRQASDFVIPQGAWTGHGIDAFDDPKFEYAKHWMSSYLLAQGSYFAATSKDSSGQELVIDRAFHSAKDYYSMAKGRLEISLTGPLGITHGQFLSLLGGDDPNILAVHRYSEQPPVAAMIFWPMALFPEKTETVTTLCGLYDVARSSSGPVSVYLPNTENVYGTPAERASTLVHEAMHAHYREQKALDHVDCATGQANSDGACDHFYPHKKSDYAGDDLYIADAGSRKLPAYEIQYEYLCDLLDESRDWVPLAVLSDAVGAVDRLENNKFVDTGGKKAEPPFSCGTPSPMMAPPSGTAPACELDGCSVTTTCQTGMCDNGCCVVVK